MILPRGARALSQRGRHPDVRGVRSRRQRSIAALLAVLIAASPAAALAGDPPDKDPSAGSEGADAAAPSPGSEDGDSKPDDLAAKKAEARDHFDKGRKLSTEGAWSAALAEFLASRELYPTSGNTLGAASSFRKLARFDEALDMFELLLREHGASLSPDVRTAAQREVVELRGLVGTIEIEGAEIGAAITVDGRDRGEYPAPSPLRVGAGSHVVRVSKEGYETFEARVDVAGNQTARVAAKLRQLVASGRLRVVEQTGAVLDVLVDGARVGTTPWEGNLAPGDHTLLLSGEGELGTLPVKVTVKANDSARLTLIAEKLTARIRVEPEPITASVAIDAVALGQGTWEGRLRAGTHKIEVAAPGFSATAQTIQLSDGDRTVLRIPLTRDESSPFWRKPPPPSRFIAEVAGSVPILPRFASDIANGCGAGCNVAPGFGAFVAARAGYELSSGFGFGLTVGFLFVEQSISGREAVLSPVGIDGQARGRLDHTVAIRRSALIGPWLGFSYGEKFPVHVRVSAGPLFAQVGETRKGTMTPVREGADYPVGPLSVSDLGAFIHITPDVRIGYRVTPQFEISFGVDAILMIPLTTPSWDATRPINAGVDGIGTFPAEQFVGDLVFGIAPGFGARYDFF